MWCLISTWFLPLSASRCACTGRRRCNAQLVCVCVCVSVSVARRRHRDVAQTATVVIPDSALWCEGVKCVFSKLISYAHTPRTHTFLGPLNELHSATVHSYAVTRARSAMCRYGLSHFCFAIRVHYAGNLHAHLHRVRLCVVTIYANSCRRISLSKCCSTCIGFLRACISAPVVK